MEAGVASLFSLHAIASFQKQTRIARLVGKLDWAPKHFNTIMYYCK